MAIDHNTTIRPSRFNYRKESLPTNQELLAEANRIYSYDPVNGGLIWKAYKDPRRSGRAKIGNKVGGDDGHGYLMCMLLGHKFKVHQVVWLICHGEFPKMSIDHINRNRRDNKIDNLRLATDQQNMFNIHASTKKYVGVRKDDKGHGYSANIGHNNKKIYLGYFKTKEEAYEAYVKASREIRGEFSPV